MTLALGSNVKRTGKFGKLRLQLMLNIVLAVDTVHHVLGWASYCKFDGIGFSASDNAEINAFAASIAGLTAQDFDRSAQMALACQSW